MVLGIRNTIGEVRRILISISGAVTPFFGGGGGGLAAQVIMDAYGECITDGGFPPHPFLEYLAPVIKAIEDLKEAFDGVNAFYLLFFKPRQDCMRRSNERALPVGAG